MDELNEYLEWSADSNKSNAAAGALVVSSQDAQPDQAAGDLRLSQEFAKLTGNPAPTREMLGQNKSAFQRMVDQAKAATALSEAPRLASFVRNPNNAAVVKDDIDWLAGIEKAARTSWVPRVTEKTVTGDPTATMSSAEFAGRYVKNTVTAVPGGVVSGAGLAVEATGQLLRPVDPAERIAFATRVSKALELTQEQLAALRQEISKQGVINPSYTQSILSDLLAGDLTPEQVVEALGPQLGPGLKVASDALQEAGPKVQDFGDNLISADAGFEDSSSRAIGGGIGSLLAILAAAVASGGAAGAAGGSAAVGSTIGGATAGALMTSGEMVADARKHGASEDVQTISGLIGLGVGLTEIIPVERLLNNKVVREGLVGFLRSNLTQGAMEGSQELAQQIMQNVAAIELYDKDRSITEGLKESFATGGVIGVLMDVAHIGTRGLMGKRAQAVSAEQRQQVFQEIAGQSAGSKTRERMPETYRDFVETVTRDGPIENVYVPAQVLNDYFQSVGVDPTAVIGTLEGVTQDDFDVALATGGDLRIPTATYAARLAGSDADAVLIPNMRFNPLDMTAIEAREFNEKAQEALQEAWEEAQRVTAEFEERRTFEQEIYDTMVSRLRAAGRSTDVATSEAMLWPAFYRVMAERSGLTVQEMMQRYPLPNVAGAIPEGMQFKTVDDLKLALANARKAKQPKETRSSLAEWLDSYGGVNDAGGELRAMGAAEIKRGPGKKTLKLSRPEDAPSMFDSGTRKKHGADVVAMAAVEAGYLRDRPEVQAYLAAAKNGTVAPDITGAMWDALREEVAGRPAYPADPEAEARASEAQKLNDIEEYLASLGMSLDNTDEDIRKAIDADQGSGRSYGQAGREPSITRDVEVWRGKLRDLLRNKLPEGADLRVGRVGAILRAIGVPSGQVVFRGSKVRKVIREHGNIGSSTLIDLPLLIADPLAIYEETGKESDFVLVTDRATSAGSPIVIAIKAEGSSNGAPATVVLTVYPLDNAAERLPLVAKAGKLRYVRDGAAGAKSEPTGANSLKGLLAQALGQRPRNNKILTSKDVFKGDEQPPSRTLYQGDQGPRGMISFDGRGGSILKLFETADLSTVLHEGGHFFLKTMQTMERAGELPSTDGMATLRKWWGENSRAVFADAKKVMPDVALTDADLKAYLADGTTGNLMKDAALDVGTQEQFARGFEAYLMEGKAPSTELREVFRRFRAWLLEVYRKLRGLNVTINDEVRGVFDRMLATDAEIETARSSAGDSGPVFTSAEMLGLTQEQFAKFMKAREVAEADSEARVTAEIMRPLREQREKWYAKELQEVRAEVERQVNAMPVYRALEWFGNRRWLGEGRRELPDARLSKDILVERYGEGVLSLLPRGQFTIYTNEGGLDPDVAADLFGFSSGDQMVKAVQEAPKRKEAIDAETKRVMYERHGDPLTDGSVENEALVAVHGDRKADWMAAELKAIADVAGLPKQMTAKEAMATAKSTLARSRVRDAVHADRFLAAERKAGQEAAKLGAMLAREKLWVDAARRKVTAKAKGAIAGTASPEAVSPAIDRANAATLRQNEVVTKLIEAKRRQLLNHALYAEARKVADEVEKAENYIRKLNKASNREKIAGAGRRDGMTLGTGGEPVSAAVDYLSAIDEILERYDFRRMSASAEARRGALVAFVDGMKAAGRENELAIPETVLADLGRKPYKTIPMEELRGVVDSLKNIEHLAKRWDALIDERGKRLLDEAAGEIVGAFNANMPKRPPGRVATTGENRRDGVRKYLNLTLNTSTMLREIDGFEDLGPAFRNIKSPIDAAVNSMIRRKQKAALDVEALYKPYSKQERRAMNVRRFVPKLGQSLSKWEMISVALNCGNDGNYQRLTDSRVRGSFTPAQVDTILASLDERDARFVQSVWDYLESFKTDLAARERRVSGVEPKWVEGRPVTIADLDLKGGYYPIKYDGRLGGLAADFAQQDIADAVMGGRFGKAQTRNGHLKARGSGAVGTVDLSPSVFHSHVNQVIYDLEMSEAVANAWRLLHHPDIRSSFTDAGRAADFETLEAWVKDVAEGDLRPADIVGRLVSTGKANFTAAKLAFNLSNTLAQVAGLAQTIVVVGKKDFAHGVKAMFQPGIRDQIVAKSAFMSERQTTFNKDVFDYANDPKFGPLASRWGDFKKDIVAPLSFWLMTKVQWHCADVPTWLAGYHQGLRRFGNNEAKAIEHADNVVKRAQASGLFADRSAIERGSLSVQKRQNAVLKLFTTLASYSFAKFNIAYERSARAGRVIGEEGVSVRSAAEVLSFTLDMVFLFTVDAVILAAIKGRLPDGDDEDDDGWMMFLAKETGLNMMATAPGIRDASSVLQGFDSGGAYGAMLGEMTAPFQQAIQGDVDKGLVKSIINFAGLTTGAPSTQVNRVVDAMWRQSEGDDVAPIEFLMGRMGGAKK